MHARQSEEGFILISLSILLIVLGLAISAYLLSTKVKEEETRRQKTDAAFAGVMNKMASYLSANGRLPCPAPRNLTPTDTQYGMETTCTAAGFPVNTCTNGVCVTTANSKRVRVGIVPFKTLKIDKTDATDAYGNFMTYAVTEDQATQYNDSGGAIDFTQIKDEIVSGATVRTTTNQKVNFALISHGEDGAGSYLPNGQPNPEACTAGTGDFENCDYSNGNFISLPYSTANGADHFDDQVETVLLDWVYIWDTTYGDSKGSYSRGELESNIGVGTEDPQARLHVGNGGNLRIEDGSLSTKNICDKNSTNCFNPNVLGGDADEAVTPKKGMACPSDRLMIDIKEGKAVCGTFSSPKTSSCSEDEFFGVISYSGVGLQATCVNALTGATRSIVID